MVVAGEEYLSYKMKVADSLSAFHATVEGDSDETCPLTLEWAAGEIKFLENQYKDDKEIWIAAEQQDENGTFATLTQEGSDAIQNVKVLR